MPGGTTSGGCPIPIPPPVVPRGVATSRRVVVITAAVAFGSTCQARAVTMFSGPRTGPRTGSTKDGSGGEPVSTPLSENGGGATG